MRQVATVDVVEVVVAVAAAAGQHSTRWVGKNRVEGRPGLVYDVGVYFYTRSTRATKNPPRPAQRLSSIRLISLFAFG